MAQNFLNLLKPQADVSKNVFDLSRKHVFSSKPGQLLPVLSVETVPGDKFKIDLASLQRTMTLNTAAFVRGKFKYDFFFVPYSQLWHPFNQFISQRDDKHSTRQLMHNYCPLIDLPNFLFGLFEANGADASYCPVDVFGADCPRDIVRLMDLLGYGNFDALLDMDDTAAGEFIQEFAGVKLNLFRIAAYQHIFYDYYRNKYYDVDVTGGPNSEAYLGFYRDYLKLFNFDDLTCSSVDNATLPFSTDDELKRLLNLFTIRYHGWKKDLFTSALPSQQFGAVSSVDISSDAIHFVPGANEPQTQRIDYYSLVSPSDSSHIVAVKNNSIIANGYSGSWNIPNAFDVLSMRKAELLQRWKQNTLRAGNMTDDSFRAHFGVEPFYDSDENVRYLGSFESVLQINPIEATAATQSNVNGKVGDIAATGSSVTNGKSIHFECNDFGIIQCIASFVPDIEYRSDMIDKNNRLYEQFDFFTPEFQNIGLDPLIGADFDCTSNVNAASSPYRLAVFGYAPRYWNYKTAVDKCFGEFAHGALKPWVAPRNAARVSQNHEEQVLSNFYIRPDIYDEIFGVRTDVNQNTDTFLHNVFFDIKAIRPMSVLGLPEF